MTVASITEVFEGLYNVFVALYNTAPLIWEWASTEIYIEDGFDFFNGMTPIELLFGGSLIILLGGILIKWLLSIF